MGFEGCLPADLRTRNPTITPVSMGLSGAGVYRVEAAEDVFVLKISNHAEPIADWRRKVALQELTANAGLAPRVIHTDETRRAIVTAFVADRSFSAFYLDPRTHATALAQLGRTLRGVHDLPLPSAAQRKDPKELIAAAWSGLEGELRPAGVRRRRSPARACRGRACPRAHVGAEPQRRQSGEHRLRRREAAAARLGYCGSERSLLRSRDDLRLPSHGR